MSDKLFKNDLMRVQQQIASLQSISSPLIVPRDNKTVYPELKEVDINEFENIPIPPNEYNTCTLGWSTLQIFSHVFVNNTPMKGRCLYAAKDFEPGNIIYCENPTMVVVTNNTSDIYKKLEELNSIKPFDVPIVWHYAALNCLLHEDENIRRVCDSKWFPDNDEDFFTLNQATEILQQLNLIDVIDPYKYYKYLLIWRYNSFGHHSDNQGLVLYNVTSLMSHSCLPSAVWTFGEHDSFVLRARGYIKKGEEITISYLGDDESVKSIPKRRERLIGWKFTCQCVKCNTLVDHCRGFRCQRCYTGNCYYTKLNLAQAITLYNKMIAENEDHTNVVIKSNNDNNYFLKIGLDGLMYDFEKLKQLLNNSTDQNDTDFLNKKMSETLEEIRLLENKCEYYNNNDIYMSKDESTYKSILLHKLVTYIKANDTSATFEYTTKCNVCNHFPHNDQLAELLQLEELYSERVMSIDFNDSDDIIAVWSEGKRVFNQHYLSYQMNSLLIECYKAKKQYLNVITACIAKINLLKLMFSTTSFALAWSLDELGDAIGLLTNVHFTSDFSLNENIQELEVVKSTNPLSDDILNVLSNSAKVAAQNIDSYWLQIAVAAYEEAYHHFLILCGPFHVYTNISKDKWVVSHESLNAYNKRYHT